MDRDDEIREERLGERSEDVAGGRLVRAGFLLGAVMPPFARLAVALYCVLWFLLPAGPDRPSALDRLVDAGSALLGDTRRRARRAQSASSP
jgi:hypothetical protein